MKNNINNMPKAHNKPHTEGKYHYRYRDPYDTDHINCIDCYAPYAYNWTNKEKEKLAYLSGKNHYSCTFNTKFQYNNNTELEYITKTVSKKFVCFLCRNIIKRPINRSWNYSYNQYCYSGPWNDKKHLKYNTMFKWPQCYKCKNNMICVNSVFKVPNKKNDKSWNYLEKHLDKSSKLTYEEYIYTK